MAVSFSGELAYEVHVPNASLYAAYLALREAGGLHGLRLFGSLAVDSMRLEKGYLHWKADILTEFDPFETGLARFVDMNKADFIGKTALEKRRAEGVCRQLVTIKLNSTDAAAHGGASVMRGGKVIGTVTSGGWGHRTGKNIAYAFVDPALSDQGTQLEIDVLGRMVSAQITDPALYDPQMTRPRG